MLINHLDLKKIKVFLYVFKKFNSDICLDFTNVMLVLLYAQNKKKCFFSLCIPSLFIFGKTLWLHEPLRDLEPHFQKKYFSLPLQVLFFNPIKITF